MPVKVSIIMTVRDVETYINDCVVSIQNQSFTDWELIIVNDHSNDNTEAILHNILATDTRIMLFQNQGRGINPALQMALQKCNGEFLTRFDGDDLMPQGRLELMVNVLESSPPKTIVTGKVKYFSDQPVSKGYLKYEAWLNQRIDQKDHWHWVYRECVIASPNWIMRRKDLQDIKPLGAMSYPEDYNLVLEWYQAGFSVQMVNSVTLHWREHPERTSRNSDHYNQQHFFQLKLKHFITHELMDHGLVLWGTDIKGRLTAQLLDELKVSFHWMGLEPNIHKLNGHTILPYTTIASMSKVKLLLAVYPPQKQRQELENYLNGLGLQLGLNYWYL